MDIVLLKTFLAVSETGSFIAASDRLHVTQSAVSLRVQRLEEMLGQPLFVRAKTGTELTPGGRAFTAHAQALLHSWERARQAIASAEDQSRALVIGAEPALWSRLGFHWLDRLIESRPDLVIRCAAGTPDTLARAMQDGAMQVCLAHAPLTAATLRAEKIAEDELVLLAPWPDPVLDDMPGRYALIDWGPEFLATHAGRPELADPVLTFDQTCPATGFLIDRGLAAYQPMALCVERIAAGQAAVVPDAPRFAHAVWSVWSDGLSEDLATVARKTLLAAVREAEVGAPAGKTPLMRPQSSPGFPTASQHFQYLG